MSGGMRRDKNDHLASETKSCSHDFTSSFSCMIYMIWDMPSETHHIRWGLQGCDRSLNDRTNGSNLDGDIMVTSWWQGKYLLPCADVFFFVRIPATWARLVTKHALWSQSPGAPLISNDPEVELENVGRHSRIRWSVNVGDHLKEAQRNQRMFEAMETLTSQFHATEPRISGRFMTDHVPIDNFGVHPFMEPPARGKLITNIQWWRCF